MTIESSPTVESKVKEETTKASTEESMKESTEKSTKEIELQTSKTEEETSKVEVTKEETTSEKQETTETVEEGNSKATEDFNDWGSLLQPKQISPKAAFSFPQSTYQFGFVDEVGKLVNPADINITYDYKSIAYRIGNGGTATVSYGTIATNQSATTVGNLKNVTLPATSINRPSEPEKGYNSEVYSNFSIKLPKYYQSVNIYDKTGKINPNYPVPVVTRIHSTLDNEVKTEPAVIQALALTQRQDDQSYTPRETQINLDPSVKFPDFLRRYHYSLDVGMFPGNAEYQTFSGPVYYHLTNRKVTENFVDASGAKLPSAPTGFTQGKQTVIDSDPYTFKQSGTLPKSYKGTDGKTYVLKGWYKGKTKPSTLRTDAPSYKVTYDDNDDLNVVYEETEAAEFPEETYQFGFVDEAGKLVNPADINITYDYKSIAYRIGNGGTATVSYGTIATNQSATTVGNLKNVTLPATSINRPSEPEKGYNSEVYSNFSIKLPKYYQSVNIYDKTGKINPNYPVPVVTRIHSTLDNEVKTEPAVIQALALTQRQDDQSYTPRETQINLDPSVKFPDFLRRYHYSLDVGMFPGNAEYQTFSGPVYYHLTNRKVTENFVDDTGAKLPSAPTGFTQGNQIPMTSDTFKYTAVKALPASYTAGGKTYIFQGWYKGKTKPNTLTTSTTPTYNTTFDDNDDMTAVYKEASISANLTMRGAVDIIDNGATMEYWEVLLKNTGEAPLTSIKIKPTAEWAAGISTPTELFLLGTGQNTKVLPITKEQWEAGFEIPLDSSLPVGGQLTINLIGTKVTGQPNQVLKAAVEVTGNFGNLKASDTVRIKDLDQETKEPTGEGFISVPTFDFGQVGVAGATKQHGLKKAADYYGNGTRNPYLRLKKTQPNWSLTAQLSQPKSAKDSLPTATRLIFGQVPVASVANYNQPTELVTSVGVTKALALTANNSSTSIIGTQEFGGADIYQLDFQFDKVKLEVPANQGTKGEQYNAAVTWNLVTGP
ncbi:WxL domain-containing protein [Enterococcus faecalis]|uniref:WxL domain-containing protein n=1 Tax=Enterococcus faecalis TaxID=1351 RepID=UPI003CC542D8